MEAKDVVEEFLELSFTPYPTIQCSLSQAQKFATRLVPLYFYESPDPFTHQVLTLFATDIARQGSPIPLSSAPHPEISLSYWVTELNTFL